ncbi:MAG: helix-hairpin-helix domain-containing protein [Pirellulales bacterium]|nr:helix-hairpin-helix domain-containing protein [Pirellulales bacterium]
MASAVTIDLRQVARGLEIPLKQIQATVELLDEGNTVPFITRYRKDQTGGLDEEQVRQIQDRLIKMRLLAERKQTILRSIESQGNLTEKLTKQILAAATTKRLEDLYLPFKPKKQTLATIARSRGLEEFAKEILAGAPECADLEKRAADYANPDRQVPTVADALLGAGHILAEDFSEQAELRQRLREILQRTGVIASVRIASEPKPPEKAEKITPLDSSFPAVSTVLGPREMHSEAALAQSPIPFDESFGSGTWEGIAQPEAQAEDASLMASVPDSEDVYIVDSTSAVTEEPAEPRPISAPGEDAEKRMVEGAAGEKEITETETDPSPPALPAERPENGNLPPQEHWDHPEVVSSIDAVSADGAAEAVEALVSTEPGGEFASSGEAAALSVDVHAVTPPLSTAVTALHAPPPTAAQRRQLERARLKQLQHERRELKKKRLEEKRIKSFRDYFAYREEIRRIPPHRVLALNRGERAKVLRAKIETDLQAMVNAVEEMLVPSTHPHGDYLRGCARDALARLILPGLEREVRRELTERAETHAVGVFAKNLRNLLLQPPVHNHRVLAVDPGFKSGCKLVALDQFGNVLEHGMIFLVGRPDRRDQARRKAKDKVTGLIKKYQITLVAIGNGTACRQVEQFIAEVLGEPLRAEGVSYVIVNEAGASVYSTSRQGREEFPDYDATLRGAISIGRRLQDPLSELVKIDPANIGVGLYQHDVKQKHLRTSLDDVVESCVNFVGVDVNMASPALLRYVSGLNQLTARRIFEQRREQGPFRNRQQLRAVPGVGETTFIQAAGFLKIPTGDQPLDATWIHPESYEAAQKVLDRLGFRPEDLADKTRVAALAERLAEVNPEELAAELGVGLLTLKDILAQLARPGRDPRDDLPPPVFKHGVLKLEDLDSGMELCGTVLNVVDFGCFVDIGMHDSGLVHISHLADRFVRDPHEVVAVGEVVKVWVLSVDKERRRVSLTMVQPGTERPHPPHRGRRPKERVGQDDNLPPPECSSADAPATGGPDSGRPPRRERRPRADHPPGDRPPRQERPPRSGGRRGDTRDGRPPRYGSPRSHSTYRPKGRPKPFTPITEEMKAGKAPMRTFGDLLQFYEFKQKPPAPPEVPGITTPEGTPSSVPLESGSAEVPPAAPPPAEPTPQLGETTSEPVTAELIPETAPTESTPEPVAVDPPQETAPAESAPESVALEPSQDTASAESASDKSPPA